MSDRERLDVIVAALVRSGEGPELEAVRAQFRYETGRDPEARELERAIRGKR